MKLVIVGPSFGATVCAPCRDAHKKCGRGVPTCTRCFEKGITCTRSLNFWPSREGIPKETQVLGQKKAGPFTWDQVLEASHATLVSRFFFRRYVMPMVLVLPKPTTTAGIINLSEKAMAPFTLPYKAGNPTTCTALKIQDTYVLAIDAYFRLCNPFYPLFSREAFYTKTRSSTLLKTVIQVGLERMPQFQATVAAKQENNLTPDDFDFLPISIDTLQCFLLVLFSVWAPSLERIRLKASFRIDRLIPLLGLHINFPSSPRWLERRLAMHMITLGSYHAGLGQSLRFTKTLWLFTSNCHLHPHFLQSIRFQHINDKIHYITSQGLYHSFTIVALASRAHALALLNRDNAYSFSQTIKRHMNHLHANYVWAWAHLAQCQGNTLLLTQSRVILALRYHNDSIELGKLALHIPLDLNEPIQTTPRTKVISCLSRDGLNMAMRNIRLVATINPQAFNPDYIRILVPSIAFIMVHYKTLKAEYGHTHLLYNALLQAKECLTRGREIQNLKASANAYLELFEFLLHYHKIIA